LPVSSDHKLLRSYFPLDSIDEACEHAAWLSKQEGILSWSGKHRPIPTFDEDAVRFDPIKNDIDRFSLALVVELSYQHHRRGIDFQRSASQLAVEALSAATEFNEILGDSIDIGAALPGLLTQWQLLQCPSDTLHFDDARYLHIHGEATGKSLPGLERIIEHSDNAVIHITDLTARF
jgi:hypothetical protein